MLVPKRSPLNAHWMLFTAFSRSKPWTLQDHRCRESPGDLQRIGLFDQIRHGPLFCMALSWILFTTSQKHSSFTQNTRHHCAPMVGWPFCWTPSKNPLQLPPIQHKTCLSGNKCKTIAAWPVMWWEIPTTTEHPWPFHPHCYIHLQYRHDRLYIWALLTRFWEPFFCTSKSMDGFPWHPRKKLPRVSTQQNSQESNLITDPSYKGVLHPDRNHRNPCDLDRPNVGPNGSKCHRK